MNFTQKLKKIEAEFENTKNEIGEIEKQQNQLTQMRTEKTENLARLRGQFELIQEILKNKKQKCKTK